MLRGMLEQAAVPLIEVSHIRVARDVYERLRTSAEPAVAYAPTYGAALGVSILIDDTLAPGEWRVVRRERSPLMRPARDEDLAASIEQDNRRDAQAAGELEPRFDGHRGAPWWTPSPDDEP